MVKRIDAPMMQETANRKNLRDDDAPLYPPTVSPPAKVLPLLPFLAKFVRNPISTLPQAAYEDRFVRVGLGLGRFVWIMDPELIETVLLSKVQSFPKTPIDKRVFEPILGDGILTSEGEAWRWQRKTAAPMFRHGELLSYIPTIVSAARAQVGRWRDAGSGLISDVETDMTETTFAVISRTILAGCDEAEGARIKSAGRAYLDPISWEVVAGMFKVPKWVWHPGKRRMSAAATELRSVVEGIVRRRRNDDADKDDILGRMLDARHPDTGAPMSDRQIVDNVTTFLTAGHETTAKALTWSLYLLARSKTWQERVRDEVARVAGGRDIVAEDIEHLHVTTQVVKEAMRLYPPAPVMTRLTKDPISLGGEELAVGTVAVIPIFAIHRHKQLWDDPDRFDPSRFAPENEKGHKRAQFMPFGFGPRTCIGASFAMLEATAILATLIQHTRFVWDGTHLPEPVSRVTLRPKGGMPLGVEMVGAVPTSAA